MSKIVNVGSVKYLVPDPEDAVAWLKATYGEQYDPVERQRVKGGLPLVWERIPPWTDAEEAAYWKRRPDLLKRRA